MSTEIPNTDPSLYPGSTLQAASQDMLVNGKQLSMFEIPVSSGKEYINNDRLMADNTEVFARLVTGGIDALKDGETVTFATVNSISMDDPWATTIRTVTCTGDGFSITEARATDTKPVDRSSEDQVQPTLGISEDQARKFCRGLEQNDYLPSFMGQLIKRGGRLGEFVKSLGYTEDGSSYPVPLALQENVRRARQEGTNIPKVRIKEVGEILEDDYVGVWAGDDEDGDDDEGEFPMSNKLEWFGHDGELDHWAGLLVFGHEAMPIGKLYAQSVKSSEVITGRKLRSDYEPDKDEVELSGQDKTKHSAFCLDQFTNQLYEMTYHLDAEPYGENFEPVPVHKDYIDEMVSVILSSQEHAPKLISYLESIGSKSMESGSFDREIFARELLDGAQKFWGITPKGPEPPTTHSDSDY